MWFPEIKEFLCRIHVKKLAYNTCYILHADQEFYSKDIVHPFNNAGSGCKFTSTKNICILKNTVFWAHL